MPVGLVGQKSGMTRIFTEEGRSIPVTVVEVSPNRVTQVKTRERDGHCTFQVTTGTRKDKHLSKAERGHFAAVGVAAGRGLWEFRAEKEELAEALGVQIEAKAEMMGEAEQKTEQKVAEEEKAEAKSEKSEKVEGQEGQEEQQAEGAEGKTAGDEQKADHRSDGATDQGSETTFAPGSELTVALFRQGQRVDVTGISKGKGFAGVVKRWNFKTQDMTHGNSLSHRAPGSIGANQDPGKVWKGKKMAGQMGNARTSVQNLEIVRVDTENNLLLIKGAVPGAPGTDLLVRSAIKART